MPGLGQGLTQINAQRRRLRRVRRFFGLRNKKFIRIYLPAVWQAGLRPNLMAENYNILSPIVSNR